MTTLQNNIPLIASVAGLGLVGAITYTFFYTDEAADWLEMFEDIFDFTDSSAVPVVTDDSAMGEFNVDDIFNNTDFTNEEPIMLKIINPDNGGDEDEDEDEEGDADEPQEPVKKPKSSKNKSKKKEPDTEPNNVPIFTDKSKKKSKRSKEDLIPTLNIDDAPL